MSFSHLSLGGTASLRDSGVVAICLGPWAHLPIWPLGCPLRLGAVCPTCLWAWGCGLLFLLPSAECFHMHAKPLISDEIMSVIPSLHTASASPPPWLRDAAGGVPLPISPTAGPGPPPVCSLCIGLQALIPYAEILVMVVSLFQKFSVTELFGPPVLFRPSACNLGRTDRSKR